MRLICKEAERERERERDAMEIVSSFLTPVHGAKERDASASRKEESKKMSGGHVNW